MTIVIDASACVAALTDDGPAGRWAEDVLSRPPVVAPQLLLVEATDVLRRLVASGRLDDGDASAARHDLMSLPVDLHAFEPLADRVWALRHNVSSYDAWYVALAERLDAPLATLDRRLVGASGALCRFMSVDGS